MTDVRVRELERALAAEPTDMVVRGELTSEYLRSDCGLMWLWWWNTVAIQVVPDDLPVRKVWVTGVGMTICGPDVTHITRADKNKNLQEGAVLACLPEESLFERPINLFEACVRLNASGPVLYSLKRKACIAISKSLCSGVDIHLEKPVGVDAPPPYVTLNANAPTVVVPLPAPPVSTACPYCQDPDPVRGPDPARGVQSAWNRPRRCAACHEELPPDFPP